MKNQQQHTGMRMTRPEDLAFWCLLQAVTALVPRDQWSMILYDMRCAVKGL